MMHLDILAIGAHPDDVELFAGGTMARMAALGHATGIVDLSRGELGTRGTPALRRQESERAAEILGLRIRENLDLPDGDIPVSKDARLKVIKKLREFRPAIVLTHHWDDRHPDHVNAGRLVSEAVHHSGLAKIETGQERYRPPVVLYFKLPPGVAPSFVVDVSDFVEQREAAIRAYRSQLYDPESQAPSTNLSHPDFLANVDAIHAYYGTLIGKRRGEGFHIKSILEIGDLVTHFAS